MLPMVVLVSVAVVVMLVAAAVVVAMLVAAVAAGLGPHLDDLRAALLQTLRRRLLRRRLRLDLDDLRPLGLDLDAAHAPPALGFRHTRMRGVEELFTQHVEVCYAAAALASSATKPLASRACLLRRRGARRATPCAC